MGEERLIGKHLADEALRRANLMLGCPWCLGEGRVTRMGVDQAVNETCVDCGGTGNWSGEHYESD